MSHYAYPIHALLFPAEDVRGVFCSWCPELDIYTQGGGPEHSIGMIADAIRMTAEEDLSSFQWPSVFSRARKPVYHPMRRGGFVGNADDEEVAAFDSYSNRTGSWKRVASIQTHLLDSRFRYAVVNGTLSIRCRGGVLLCDTGFSSHAFVPARTFDVEVSHRSLSKTTVSVPDAFLDGRDDMAVALIAARRQLDVNGGDLVSIRESLVE